MPVAAMWVIAIRLSAPTTMLMTMCNANRDNNVGGRDGNANRDNNAGGHVAMPSTTTTWVAMWQCQP
jgi:hypothetical protein